MVHFFLQRGHSLKELLSLTSEERMLMMMSMEIAYEEEAEIAERINKQ
jgi:hypothetical protein